MNKKQKTPIINNSATDKALKKRLLSLEHKEIVAMTIKMQDTTNEVMFPLFLLCGCFIFRFE